MSDRGYTITLTVTEYDAMKERITELERCLDGGVDCANERIALKTALRSIIQRQAGHGTVVLNEHDFRGLRKLIGSSVETFVPTGAGGNSRAFICCEGVGKHEPGCTALETDVYRRVPASTTIINESPIESAVIGKLETGDKPLARDDRTDAERYRFLRKWTIQNIYDFPITTAPTSPEHYDQLVSSAMASESKTVCGAIGHQLIGKCPKCGCEMVELLTVKIGAKDV